MPETMLKGTGVAMVTPFKEDKSIDYDSLEKLINHVIDGGVNYLVALGTTGETPSLSTEEKHSIIEFVKGINNKRVPLVVGMGGNNTSSLTATIRQVDYSDIDAILSVSPYYNKPTQEGLYRHFKAVAEASKVPVILYNVPGRTGSNISASSCTGLAKNFEGKIIAVKEASGDLSQITAIIKDKPSGFLVISGDDAMTLPMVAMGGSGVISVIANAYPGEFSEMVRLALDHQFYQARMIHYRLLSVMKALFEEGNPAGVKAFLTYKGIIQNNLRLPLVKVSKDLYTRITELAKTLE